MERKVEVGQKYRHFKGFTATVLLLAKDSETKEDVVVYEHDGQNWVRPLAMFLSKTDRDKYPNADQEYRFELIEEGK